MSERWLLGVPFDGGSPRGGARGGFAAIHQYLEKHDPDVLAAFDRVEDLDEDRWSFLDRERLERRLGRATGAAGRFVVSVGGDHSITFYAVDALWRRFPDLALVQLDAHTDASRTRGEFVSHGNFLRNLNRRGPLRSFVLGVRGDERKLRDLDAEVLPARETGAGAAVAWLESHRAELSSRPVYLTLDVDVLDPVWCPGVGFPIAGGLDPEELLAVVELLAGWGLAGADLVEYVPQLDPDRVALPSLARLLEVLSRSAIRPSPVPRVDSPLKTRAMDAGGVEEAVEAGYRSPLEQLRVRYGLASPASLDRPGPIVGTGAGLAGVSAGYEEDPGPALVIGGPCLYHTQGDPCRMTLRDLVDLVRPIALAARTGLPCLLFLEAEENDVGQPLTASWEESLHRFGRVFDVLRHFAERIARQHGLSIGNLTIVSTNESGVRALLAPAVEESEQMVVDEALDGLYSIDGSSDYPGSAPHAPALRKAYRRSLATYLPPVAAEVADVDASRLLVAENLDQARAVWTARRWHVRRGGDPQDVVHLAHLSAPGRTGNPMQRERSTGILGAATMEETLSALAHAPDLVRRVYASIWPEPAGYRNRGPLASTARVLTSFAGALRDVEAKSPRRAEEPAGRCRAATG